MERGYLAPGRVNLIGEHTDYSGGLVLPAAIDRGTTLAVDAVGAGEHVVVSSATEPGEARIAVDGTVVDGPGWGRYVGAVVAELADAGVTPPPFRGSLTSDLPHGAGLSSSAALEVVVATAVLDLADAAMDPLDVARLAQRAEHRATGTRTGIMDQAAIILGREGCGILLDTGTLEHEAIPLPDGLAVVIVGTVPRQLEHSGYGARRGELEASYTALDGREVRDLVPADLPAIEARLDPVPARRLRHVVTENERVRRVRALLTGDERDDAAVRRGLGALFAEGHAAMRDLFEASHPVIDRLVDVALDAGAVAARITGGGFGGSIVTLVDVDDLDAFSVAMTEGARAAGVADPDVHRCRAADGARRIA